MLQVLPLLAWLAAITSAVLLTNLWSLHGLRRLTLGALLSWFLVAAYCQFLGGSPMASAAGLCLQTMLAITLMVRFRLSD